MSHQAWFVNEHGSLYVGCESCSWRKLIEGNNGTAHEAMRYSVILHRQAMNGIADAVANDPTRRFINE